MKQLILIILFFFIYNHATAFNEEVNIKEEKNIKTVSAKKFFKLRMKYRHAYKMLQVFEIRKETDDYVYGGDIFAHEYTQGYQTFTNIVKCKKSLLINEFPEYKTFSGKVAKQIIRKESKNNGPEFGSSHRINDRKTQYEYDDKYYIFTISYKFKIGDNPKWNFFKMVVKVNKNNIKDVTSKSEISEIKS